VGCAPQREAVLVPRTPAPDIGRGRCRGEGL